MSSATLSSNVEVPWMAISSKFHGIPLIPCRGRPPLNSQGDCRKTARALALFSATGNDTMTPFSALEVLRPANMPLYFGGNHTVGSRATLGGALGEKSGKKEVNNAISSKGRLRKVSRTTKFKRRGTLNEGIFQI